MREAKVGKSEKAISYNPNLSGSFIATFITKNKIFLFSDGRLTNTQTGVVNDSTSKVHELTRQVGMLAAGSHMPYLGSHIAEVCAHEGIVFVHGVVDITKLALETIWRDFSERPDNRDKVEDVRIFVFVSGFDSSMTPHMYYLDNMSNPRFKPQHRVLFQAGNDLEIGAISTGSGENVNPSSILTKQIESQIKTARGKYNLEEVLHLTFDSTKAELGIKNNWIGGDTFIAEIEAASGFKWIAR